MIAGGALLGIAGLRVGALPRWAGLTLIVSAALVNVPAVTVPYAIPRSSAASCSARGWAGGNTRSGQTD